ncbi:GNAT family N-acetyltransferase [Gluconacetobacter tumulisoli]|uniref:GNAT family N-acetyltransferase n=2 Tax=Gluconacetobacter tumulisoli TaxID=1286189 RepID=A0A7W4K5C9_9PROT|nr:GNAT family N-acetyltransferase [Gluconacetobacter tumulisoli]
MNEVYLEPLRPEDAPDMFSGLSDDRAYRFIPDDPPATLDALRDRYVFLSSGGTQDGTEVWLNWAVRRTADQQPVGYTQATLTGDNALVAYHVFPAFWRQGVATRAMKLTLADIFRRPQIKVAHAFVDTRNTASIALLRTLYFNLVRTVPDADFFKGATSHEYEFRLQREAWLQKSIPSKAE